ncbi:single-stranded DNA-binding protein [Streptomyces sp. NPDC091040]|uniref:single-stranded DNA-binding protein n=1 Tax=Streptomyces sp. NPDC091040 TaxID=3365972 RepID=UPI00381EE456
MNETLVTLVGNAATAVEFRETASGGMARFRFAVTPRRWDRAKEVWADGHTSFYTVWAWRALAQNLTGSVAVGEPLVVHGRLKVREEELEGQRRTFVDIEAVAVGHDLTRGTAAFRRVVRGEPGLTSRYGPAPVAAGADPWAVREAPERPGEEPVGGGEPVGGAEPSGEAPVRERPVRRRTARQKDGAAPRKPDSDLVTA